MSTHTPGPWMFGIADYPVTELSISADTGPIARMVAPLRDASYEQFTANQRLMIAAPDLYDAAENALNVIIACCKPTDGVDDAKAIADARRMLCAAIAKAKGE